MNKNVICACKDTSLPWKAYKDTFHSQVGRWFSLCLSPGIRHAPQNRNRKGKTGSESLLIRIIGEADTGRL